MVNICDADKGIAIVFWWKTIDPTLASEECRRYSCYDTVFACGRMGRVKYDNQMSKVLVSYLRHEKAIKKYLYRFFTHPQDVDDVAQEAFIKVFATETRTEVRNPKGLLFRAAKHAALTALSKKANKNHDYMDEVTSNGSELADEKSCNAEDVLDSRRKLAALSIAISELPPVCRKVFVMRKIEELPIKEIAARLQISVSSVEKYGAQGLVKCNRRMCEFGYDPQEFGAVRRKAGAIISNKYSERETKAAPNYE